MIELCYAKTVATVTSLQKKLGTENKFKVTSTKDHHAELLTLYTVAGVA